jgi:hypothetical protein
MASPEPIPGKCGAKVYRRHDDGTRTLAGYCVKNPMREQTRCASHGGKAPQNVKAALVKVEQKRIVTEFARLGIERVDDPIGKMHDCVSESVAWLDHLRGKVADLDRYETFGLEGGEQVKAVVKLYTEALDRAHKFLESWVRLDMDSRRMAVDQAKARVTLDAVIAVLDAALDSAGLSEEQKVAVRRAIGEAL